MKANRYLGVSVDLPTDDTSVHYDEAKHGTWSDFLARAIPDTDGALSRYAFPGGYEIVYVLGEGDEICAPCANKLLTDRIESFASGEATAEDIHAGNYYARGEIFIGYDLMANTDSCVLCEDCHTFVTASGCMPCDKDGRTEDDIYSAYHELRRMLFDGNVLPSGTFSHEDRMSYLSDLEQALKATLAEHEASVCGLHHGEYCSYHAEDAYNALSESAKREAEANGRALAEDGY